MTIPDPIESVLGVPLLGIVPLLVELAKRHGLPGRFAGLAAIVIATILLGTGRVALGEPIAVEAVARWVLGGMVYGLAAAGLYSQRRVFDHPDFDDSGPPLRHA